MPIGAGEPVGETLEQPGDPVHQLVAQAAELVPRDGQGDRTRSARERWHGWRDPVRAGSGAVGHWGVLTVRDGQGSTRK